MYSVFAAFQFVTQTEQDAVMRMYDWQELSFENDKQLYYRSSFVRGGQEYTVVASRQNEMGMTAAATLSMKLIEHFRPQYLVMPGIAAGIINNYQSEQQIYGDVLLADAVWNYSNGKYVSPEKSDIRFGTVGFIPRPTMVRLSSTLLPYLQNCAEDPANECAVHVGHLASGSAVVANQELVSKQIYGQYANTTGIEMEGYGVAYAAREATEPRPHAVIAKSICDFADSRKNDNYQRFAAYTSCEFCKFLVEKHLPDRNLTDI